MKKTLIYLADLVHDYISKGPFVFPLNIGYIASYTYSIFGDNVEIRLFKFPQDLINEIKKEKPDIVGLSNYTWNIDLNNKIFDLCKTISKDILTIAGGPDFPVDLDEACNYLKERKNLDFYVVYQGEIGFVNIVKKYFEKNNISEMKKEEIENCCYYNSKQNKLIIGNKNRFKDLDQLSSPYLTGLMDKFFDENYMPIIETNRGCPYSCTFCAWGKSVQKKMLKFPIDQVKNEIKYIAKRVKNTNILFIGDSNFGIFERDIEIAKYLKKIKEETGYPRHISFAFAKSSPERKLKIAEILKEITSVTASFQSLNPKVLKLIKRNNAANEFFLKYKNSIPEGMMSHSELILGLPGETKESHENAIRVLFDSNIGSIICYNLIMFGGSELNTLKQREQHGLKTKFRLLDNGFGKYNGFTSIETHEIVLRTNTMTKSETLYFRSIHWLIQFMWNYKYYFELLHFLKNENINPLDFIIQIDTNSSKAPSPVKKVFQEFYNDRDQEWFNSKDQLVKHYTKKNSWNQLKQGSFGKLNYLYTIKTLLNCKKEFDKYLHDVALNLLAQNSIDSSENKEILNDVCKFDQYKYVDFTEGLDACKEHYIEFNYNILKWKKQNYIEHIKTYNNNSMYRFYISDEHLKALKKLYHQFEQEDMNFTLRKMIEYMKITDLFYDTQYASIDEINSIIENKKVRTIY